MELVVALLQLLPTGTLEGNLEKGLFACRKARSMGADIAPVSYTHLDVYKRQPMVRPFFW